ncbi:MAG TPA: SidA/IucD/PvdA family monooxygenase [Arenibaculum sp.]|nr:SidA/IucD/PvdA family monooxygenase [Arenibaculum sp.]
MTSPVLDLAGIGAGPFNLSVAALLDPVTELRARFFDRAPRLAWHAGLMLPGVRLQTSWLKDLVSAVAPTSPYSFTAYLVARKRFYRFLNAGFDRVMRREFADYLAWVADRLDAVEFGVDIRELDFDGDAFVLRGPQFPMQAPVRARNLVLATGVRPFVPAWAAAHLCNTCFHASRFAGLAPDLTGKRVAVIGGGQTGAEVFLHAISDGAGEAGRVLWLSRRPNFEPIDETAFTNEYFTPGYVRRFYDLPASRKAKIVEQQKLAGDGISVATIQEIYQRLYVADCLEGRGELAALLPNREVVTLERTGQSYVIAARNGLTGAVETVGADIVVLCTGFQGALPDCLGPLAERIRFDTHGRFRLSPAFAVEWDGPAANRIYAQNVGRYSHGIAEPQLSVMAWRSANIINDLLGHAAYDTGDAPDLIGWDGECTGNGVPDLAIRA